MFNYQSMTTQNPFAQDGGMSTKVIQQEILNTMREVSKSLNEVRNAIVPQTNQAAVHVGVQCENCKCTNLIGIRYKCFICENYNLCEKCEVYNQSIHASGHCFLKLCAPETMREIIANNIPCTVVEIQARLQPK